MYQANGTPDFNSLPDPTVSIVVEKMAPNSDSAPLADVPDFNSLPDPSPEVTTGTTAATSSQPLTSLAQPLVEAPGYFFTSSFYIT